MCVPSCPLLRALLRPAAALPWLVAAGALSCRLRNETAPSPPPEQPTVPVVQLEEIAAGPMQLLEAPEQPVVPLPADSLMLLGVRVPPPRPGQADDWGQTLGQPLASGSESAAMARARSAVEQLLGSPQWTNFEHEPGQAYHAVVADSEHFGAAIGAGTARQALERAYLAALGERPLPLEMAVPSAVESPPLPGRLPSAPPLAVPPLAESLSPERSEAVSSLSGPDEALADAGVPAVAQPVAAVVPCSPKPPATLAVAVRRASGRFGLVAVQRSATCEPPVVPSLVLPGSAVQVEPDALTLVLGDEAWFERAVFAKHLASAKPASASASGALDWAVDELQRHPPRLLVRLTAVERAVWTGPEAWNLPLPIAPPPPPVEGSPSVEPEPPEPLPSESEGSPAELDAGARSADQRGAPDAGAERSP